MRLTILHDDECMEVVFAGCLDMQDVLDEHVTSTHKVVEGFHSFGDQQCVAYHDPEAKSCVNLNATTFFAIATNQFFPLHGKVIIVQ